VHEEQQQLPLAAFNGATARRQAAQGEAEQMTLRWEQRESNIFFSLREDKDSAR
jgi:hypothetical protein